MDRMKETAVEMCDIVEEMRDHVPEGFLGHHVFLAAYMAIFSLHDRAAIQTVFFFALGGMGHAVFFLRPPK